MAESTNEMVVRLIWDSELGPCWMNQDNLASLLYGKTEVGEKVLGFETLSHSEPGHPLGEYSRE